ncbi:MAG: helix-turn-helix domain-containing protein, partial [Candidatus Coproplasma sp.]
MAKYKHLTLDDRIQIQSYLDRGFNFKEIGNQLHKSPSTISKEVKAHLTKKLGCYGYQRFNPCVNRADCVRTAVCGKDYCDTKRKSCAACGNCINFCDEFRYGDCRKLTQPPYCCNACPNSSACCTVRHYYYARNAHEAYRKTLSESRQGACITEKEAKRINALLQPLIAKGHSVHHACSIYRNEIMLSEKTVYTYIDSGIFNIKNIDLPRKVRYKQRKKRHETKVDPKCRTDRTYEDFLSFMQENASPPLVQMDTVKGTVSGKVLLTIHFVESGFML